MQFGIKTFGVIIIALIISVFAFNFWSVSQVDYTTIKVKDKYIFTEPGSKKHSGTVNYRVIDAITGEYFDCQPFSFNPLGPEKLWNSLQKDSTYSVKVRGYKSDYNVRFITDIE